MLRYSTIVSNFAGQIAKSIIAPTRAIGIFYYPDIHAILRAVPDEQNDMVSHRPVPIIIVRIVAFMFRAGDHLFERSKPALPPDV